MTDVQVLNDLAAAHLHKAATKFADYKKAGGTHSWKASPYCLELAAWSITNANACKIAALAFKTANEYVLASRFGVCAETLNAS
jgi:hypothetical protein